MDTLISEDIRFVEDADALSIMALQHRRYEKDFFLNIGNPKKQGKYIEKFKGVSTATRQKMKTMATYMQNDPHLSDGIKSALTEARQAYEKYVSGFMQLVVTVQADGATTPQKANKLTLQRNIYVIKFSQHDPFLSVRLIGG
jgi:methyl-accepting chemotaxis protein